MTASPDLIHELRASRPIAPVGVRETVRELAATQASRRSLPRLRLPARRLLLVAVPAAAALAVVSAGAIGLAHSRDQTVAVPKAAADASSGGAGSGGSRAQTAPRAAPGTRALGTGTSNPGYAPTPSRAQRVSATLTVQVAGSDGVSRAAQDALDLVRSLGGHVVNASVATGADAQASLTMRVPVAKVEQAVVGLSSLGKITSQQVTIDDLQESLDALSRRVASLRSQIVGITARLETQTLDPVTRAELEDRRRSLAGELRELRRSIATTAADSRFATVQLSVVTPASLGVVAGQSRLHGTLSAALDALVWEGVVALAVLVVIAPFLLIALAAWLGRRLYRRREADRLLAT
jgi:hypothetical protein